MARPYITTEWRRVLAFLLATAGVALYIRAPHGESAVPMAVDSAAVVLIVVGVLWGLRREGGER